MKHILLILFVSLSFVSCKDNFFESKYSCGNYTIIRQDWNDCMTELSFFDKEGYWIGTTLEYYPGRDGWFLADVIFGYNCIYYSPCDACPKVIVNDSSQFVINSRSTDIPVEKKRWRRISSCDDAPVVEEANMEYGSKVTKTFIRKGKTKMPDWTVFLGKYYATPSIH